MVTTDRYLHIGTIISAISSAAAIYLNFQGVECLSELNRVAEDSAVLAEEKLEELQRNCFIITNSYVYSLFGVVAGIILVMFWYVKTRRRKGKKNDWDSYRY